VHEILASLVDQLLYKASSLFHMCLPHPVLQCFLLLKIIDNLLLS